MEAGGRGSGRLGTWSPAGAVAASSGLGKVGQEGLGRVSWWLVVGVQRNIRGLDA